MYSIVLMLAVSGNPAAPAWQGDEISVAKRYGDSGHYQYRHRRGGCYGSSGCCGGYYGGGCTGGYYGSSGCCGGHYGSGCTGGYYGAGCYGSGCSGGYYGKPISNGNGHAMPKSQESSYYGQAGEAAQANDRATIIVHMPAEAKLMIDDQPTKSTSETRTFVSPALEQGKEFHYTLKAEINRDGKTTTKTKTIAVKAGQKTEVDLNAAADDSVKAAEPKAKSSQPAEQKSNQPAQPKANTDQGAQPKTNTDQGAQPKANTGQGAQPKPNSNQQAQPQP